jgi:hypothetical protein
METTIRIKANELTPDFLNTIKALFKNEKALEIAITPVSDFGLTKKESQKAHASRINKAIKNIESNKNVVVLSNDEFQTLTNDLLNQR